MKTKRTQTFALYFGNRGFFPETLIASARDEVSSAVKAAGFDFIMPPAEMTRYGAVETKDEGIVYAEWLAKHKGEYDGLIMSLPNFSDENGAVAAVRDCGVPIFIQAYPDEIGKMDFEHRRDSYCGKFSICDVFHQYGIPFTILTPHVVHPTTPEFSSNLRDFAAVCRVVNGMKRFTVGVIGARTTKFKTVRYDEITLQKYGITCDTYDLSELFYRVETMKDDEEKVVKKVERLINYTDFSAVPHDKTVTLAKISAAIDDMMEAYHLDCITLPLLGGNADSSRRCALCSFERDKCTEELLRRARQTFAPLSVCIRCFLPPKSPPPVSTGTTTMAKSRTRLSSSTAVPLRRVSWRKRVRLRITRCLRKAVPAADGEATREESPHLT